MHTSAAHILSTRLSRSTLIPDSRLAARKADYFDGAAIDDSRCWLICANPFGLL